jgi:hypothetical protein
MGISVSLDIDFWRDFMNKKVLVTVSGGVPSAYAEPGVGVVVIDYDDAKETHPDEMIPVHSSFQPLMDFCGATDACPVSNDGRQNDADYMESSDSDLDDTIMFKSLLLERPPINAKVLCVMKPGVIKGDIPVVMHLSDREQWIDSGLEFCIDFNDVQKWALLPVSLGGGHVC